MASISKHGIELGRIAFKKETRAYFSNGDILQNYDGQWRVLGKVKEGVKPQDHYEGMRARHDQWMKDHPLGAAFITKLHKVAGMKDRAKLCTAIELMPEDPDGVWSTCCDSYGDNLHADLDEIVELCRLYTACKVETKEAHQ